MLVSIEIGALCMICRDVAGVSVEGERPPI